MHMVYSPGASVLFKDESEEAHFILKLGFIMG